MAKQRFDPDRIRSFLEKERIATISQLKSALGTTGTMTVFRKLKALGYLSSYSHRGGYYTLLGIPEFDRRGLWSLHSVYFSKYGNLLETLREFVEESEAGLTVGELENFLYVECKRGALKLYREGRIERQKISGLYLYLATDAGKRRAQLLLRQEQIAGADIGLQAQMEVLSHELKAAIILFFSLLDEQQRRLYAGLESEKLGHGGDRKIAELLAMDPHTVARGRREVFSGKVDRERTRRKGGGRKPVEKKSRRS